MCEWVNMAHSDKNKKNVWQLSPSLSYLKFFRNVQVNKWMSDLGTVLTLFLCALFFRLYILYWSLWIWRKMQDGLQRFVKNGCFVALCIKLHKVPLSLAILSSLNYSESMKTKLRWWKMNSQNAQKL